MLSYGVVGALEYVVGWGIISYLSQTLPLYVAFTIQFVVVGYLVGFLLRKYLGVQEVAIQVDRFEQSSFQAERYRICNAAQKKGETA